MIETPVTRTVSAFTGVAIVGSGLIAMHLASCSAAALGSPSPAKAWAATRCRRAVRYGVASASRACVHTLVASSLALAWDGGSLRRRASSGPDAVVVIASVPR